MGCAGLYRGTSLIRNTPLPGPYRWTIPLEGPAVVLAWLAVSYERGTPVAREHREFYCLNMPLHAHTACFVGCSTSDPPQTPGGAPKGLVQPCHVNSQFSPGRDCLAGALARKDEARIILHYPGHLAFDPLRSRLLLTTDTGQECHELQATLLWAAAQRRDQPPTPPPTR